MVRLFTRMFTDNNGTIIYKNVNRQQWYDYLQFYKTILKHIVYNICWLEFSWKKW